HSTTGWPETAQAPQSAARLRPQPRHVEGDVHALVAADRYVRDVPVRGRVVTLDDGHGTVLDRLDQLLLRDRRPDLDGRNRDRGEGVRRHHLLDEGLGARVVASVVADLVEGAAPQQRAAIRVVYDALPGPPLGVAGEE